MIPDENTEFGSIQVVREGDEITFSMDVQAVNGLSSVTLWSMGKEVETIDMEGTADRETVVFTVKPDSSVDNLWYSFTAVDSKNNHALSNPVWVNVSPFSDVAAEHWAAACITELAKAGVVNGYPNSDKFLPDAKITRAEFCKIVAEMGDFQADAAVSFGDVKEGDWYYDAVNELAGAGIINGMGDGNFHPNELITREQMFKIIALASGVDMTVEYETADFADMDEVSAWAVPYVNALVGVGILNGYEDGTVRAGDNATRAEACKVCYELF